MESIRSLWGNTESDVLQEGVGLTAPDNQLMRTRVQRPDSRCRGRVRGRYSQFESRSEWDDIPNHR